MFRPGSLLKNAGQLPITICAIRFCVEKKTNRKKNTITNLKTKFLPAFCGRKNTPN